jgi:galactokinase
MNDFENLFGYSAKASAAAHGRVNLIGEHTDYNGGLVLPTLIPQSTLVDVGIRNDPVVQVVSVMPDGRKMRAEFELSNAEKHGNWTDYIKGVVAFSRRHQPSLSGMDILIRSDVPIGAGLSSSAALLVGSAKAMRAAFAIDLNDHQLALLAQRIENEFVGARVGIMDQMVASLGVQGKALLLDTADLSTRLIELPLDVMELFVINSGITHDIVHGSYQDRRTECEMGARLMGLRWLRDYEDAEGISIEQLPPLLQRRCRHVITENDRVRAAVEALESRNIRALGEILKQSHASMRDDFEVSLPEIDCLVGIANSCDGVYGARLTGGGFGGSIVGISEPSRVSTVVTEILQLYRMQTGRDAKIVVPRG